MEPTTEKMVFDSPEAIKASYNTGDREHDLAAVNAVLSGNIEIKKEDMVSIEPPKEDSVVLEVTPALTSEGTVVDTDVVSLVVPTIEEEMERQRRYNEFLEQTAKEEKEKNLIELKKREDEIKKERLAKEELENRLRQLSDLQNKQPSTSMTTQEDVDKEEDYVSEYNKRTREMVKELESRVGDSPVVKELASKIENIQKEYETKKQETLKNQQEKERVEKEEKLFGSIRDFQKTYPELTTVEDIREIDKKYSNFRKDIGNLVKAQNSLDVDRAIANFYKGGETRKLAESKGIREVPDLNKYQLIAELIDMKNGVKYDSITGREVPILDDQGIQVRYRSLDEVYKIRRYYDDMTNARKQTLKEVSKKLETVERAPTVLAPEQTDEFTSGISIEQEREILNWSPKIWQNDPEKRKLVEMVYAKRGLDIPRYRGRKI